uniref:Uncharacterized protein n=1 Tax=Rhizophagus irregularis (strain DAOM 181602 / DAOM 197198 / MUCL 43194) TaxID=747089 RepID=U9TW65_RHIID
MLKLILRKGLLHDKCEYWLRLNILIDTKQLKQAENKRLDLTQQKLLGPEFTKGCHPNTIYTSRSLRFKIIDSKSSSIKSMIFDILKQDNKLEPSIEKSYNIKGIISFILNFIKVIFRNINPTISQHPGAIYTSRPLSALISTVNVPRKRNI